MEYFLFWEGNSIKNTKIQKYKKYQKASCNAAGETGGVMGSIQDDADNIIKYRDQMKDVMKEQKEHGQAITFYKGTDGNIWGYEDKYKITLPRNK